MKPQILFLLILACATIRSGATLVTFSFNGAAGDEASLAPDFQPAHLAVSHMTRGPGLGAVAGAGTFSASSWTTGNSVDPNDFFTFSMIPDGGYAMTLGKLVLDERRSATGIRNWSVRSSVDGFVSNLAVFSVPDDANTRIDETVLLSAASFTDLIAPLTFRIYGYSAESASGTWRIDNVRVEGSAQYVPDTLPTGFAAAALFAALVLFRGTRVRCMT